VKAGQIVDGRFELERLAGSGGMCSVWRAIDRVDGSVVAVKMLHGDDTRRAERFDREARILRRVRHAGIVRYIAHGVPAAGAPFLAMEWLDGTTLASRLERGPLAVDEAVRMIACLADALGAAHAQGVVHRDVKPGNVLLAGGEAACPKLLDFGVARTEASTATLTGALVGTPAYMAPEQARGESGIGPAADVFALGCVLYECLAGCAPFVADHPIALLAKVLVDEPPRLTSLRSDVPAALADLVEVMLSKDADARPADGRAAGAALSRLLGPDAMPSTGRRPPRSLTGGEQRRLCVLLARPAVVDATADATITPDQATRSLENIRAAVAPFAARAHALVDGTFVITLNHSAVATDDAARAARCALSVRAHVDDLRLALVLGRGDAAAPLRGSDAIDRAAALLEQTSGRRGVVVDEPTAGLLGPRYRIVADEHGLELTGERPEADAARTVLGRTTPFVGRDRELGALLSLFDESRTEPVARATVVIGGPGVGKSRLCQELMQELERRDPRCVLLHARGDPLSQASPLSTISAAVRHAVGVLEGEPLEDKRRKILEHVARASADPLPDAQFLGELAGAPFDASASPRLAAARRDRVLLGDQLRGAWESFLEVECARGPVVLLVEDLHWADGSSVALIGSALRTLREQPLLVIAFARPEVADTHPNLWPEQGTGALRLGELPRRACERLVSDLLGDRPAEVLQRVVERAAGNAFYLEELVRAVAAGAGDALPETVMAMVEARLESLDPGARRALRAASVFGELFWDGAVGALLGLGPGAAELRTTLAELAECEAIVARRGAGKFAGQRELAFRHALVRDAAYGMLSESDRTLGHRLAAEWLERAGEGDAAVVADHYQRGGDAARAASWYVRAMVHAYDASHGASVISSAERALACGVTGEELGRVRHALAAVASWHGDSAATDEHLPEALARLPRDSPMWCDALALRAGTFMRRADFDALAELGASLCERLDSEHVPEPLLGTAARVTEYLLLSGRASEGRALQGRVVARSATASDVQPGTRGRIQLSRATAALADGDPALALASYQQAHTAFELAGDARNMNTAQANIAYAQLQLGGYDEAAQGLRTSARLCRKLDIPYGELIAHQNLGLALGHMGAYDEALQLETASIDGFVALGNVRLEGASRVYRGRILLWRGELDAAERDARLACVLLAELPASHAYALGVLAAVLLARGRGDDALIAAEQAMARVAEVGTLDEGDGFVQLVHAEALRAAGRARDADEAIAVARMRLEGRAAKIGQPEWRRRFLEVVPEHARTLELARRRADESSGRESSR
jgi:tetratricopeptide (TPR) repeat protein